MPCTGQEDKDKLKIKIMYDFPAGFLTLVSHPQGSLSLSAVIRRKWPRGAVTLLR